MYTSNGISGEEIWARINTTDLPKLWVPKRENVYFVESLPTLGTGKLDLRGVRVRAEGLVQEVIKN
jgi:acyl-[acyl-carrier-protein]-phospholipid O-acyltransferase/long-chain-fatty-acid--[acyl-carrier-protein] ligase